MLKIFLPTQQKIDKNIIDLNSLLIKHPSATFFMQVETDHYRNMGIYNGDLLIIDRAKSTNPNSLVVYESEGHFVLGRVFNIQNEAILAGSVVHVIHKIRDV